MDKFLCYLKGELAYKPDRDIVTLAGFVTKLVDSVDYAQEIARRMSLECLSRGGEIDHLNRHISRGGYTPTHAPKNPKPPKSGTDSVRSGDHARPEDHAGL